jgi:3-oxoacyl-[acyl-carrier protein] reductase
MTMLPEGCCCLVTGASDPGSIGYACAEGLLKAGALKVTITGRDNDKVNAAVTQLLSSTLNPKQTVTGVIGDLLKPETMANVVTESITNMGSLDILVVSGGNGGSEYLGLDVNDPLSYHLMYDMAVLSPLFLVEAAVPELQKSSLDGGGSVVMVTSMAPTIPWPDTAPYNYAKSAQNTMVQTLAFKYRTSNVRVNAVLPACIHSIKLDVMAEKKKIPIDEYAKLRAESHPMGRNGTNTDVSNAVTFLASPLSSFMTGELMQLDGGLHLSNWFNRPKLLAEYVGGTTLMD